MWGNQFQILDQFFYKKQVIFRIVKITDTCIIIASLFVEKKF